MQPNHIMKTLKTVIEFEGKMFLFEHNSDVFMTESMFLDKCWFIVKNNQVDDIEHYANMWIQVKYNKVEYEASCMQKINDLNTFVKNAQYLTKACQTRLQGF